MKQIAVLFLLLFTLMPDVGVAQTQTNITTDRLKLGRPNSNVKDLVFDMNLGTANPRFRSTADGMQFSNNGLDFLGIGSGSGGGAGGIELLSNPGFELSSTPSGYTTSGGTFSMITSGANLLFDKRTGSFTASAAGQYIRSAAMTIQPGLYNQSCLARVYWQGGDANWKVQVLDGSGTLLASGGVNAEQTLRSSLNVSQSEIGFKCPSSGSIAVQVISTAAAATIYLDNLHLGTEDRFFRQPGPISIDTYNAGVLTIAADSGGSAKGATVIDQMLVTRRGNRALIEYNYQQSAAGTSGSGEYIVSLPAGMSFDLSLITPVTVATGSTGTIGDGSSSVMQKAYLGTGHITNGSGARGPALAFAYTATTFKVIAAQAYGSYGAWANSNYGLGAGLSFRFMVDAPIAGWSTPSSQNLYVQTQAPNDLAFVNEFSAQVSDTGVVTNEPANQDWINGNCTNSGGVVTCPVNAGVFTTRPNCTATRVVTANAGGYAPLFDVALSTANSIVFRQTDHTGAAFTGSLLMNCQKVVDYRTRSTILGYVPSPINALATKTGAGTIGDAEDWVRADTTSAAFTLNLPSSAPLGKRLSITKINAGSNLVTITGSIAGVTRSTVLHGLQENIRFIGDGTTWNWESDPVRVERIKFGGSSDITVCAATPCPFVYQYTGNWVTTIGWASAGVYTFNFPAGVWYSVGPMCTFLGGLNTNSVTAARYSSPTTSAYEMRIRDSASGSGTNVYGEVMCSGLR